MKKFLFLLAFLVAAGALAQPAAPCFGPGRAGTGVCAAISGATASNAADTADSWLEIGGFKQIYVQIWSAAGTDAVVYVECSSDPQANINTVSAPWFPCSTTTTPTATGEYWFEPRARWMRLRTTQSTGSLYANVDRYNN